MYLVYMGMDDKEGKLCAAVKFAVPGCKGFIWESLAEETGEGHNATSLVTTSSC